MVEFNEWIEYVITIEVPWASVVRKHYVSITDAYPDWIYLKNTILAFDFKTTIRLGKYVHRGEYLKSYELLECLDTNKKEGESSEKTD